MDRGLFTDPDLELLGEVVVLPLSSWHLTRDRPLSLGDPQSLPSAWQRSLPSPPVSLTGVFTSSVLLLWDASPLLSWLVPSLLVVVVVQTGVFRPLLVLGVHLLVLQSDESLK